MAAYPPPSAASGAGGRTQYFYLSDLQRPVQLKVRGVQSGNLSSLAEKLLFENRGICGRCSGTCANDVPLQTDLELYVSVSIWSRGQPIGLPAHTAYRAAQPIDPTSNGGAPAAASSSSSSSSSNSSLSSSVGASGSASGLGAFSGSASTDAAGSGLGSLSCQVRWDSWLQFPVQYRDLDHASKFGITVWCVAHGTGVRTENPTLKPFPHAAPEASGKPCSCHASPSQLSVHSRLFAVGGCSLPIFNKRGLLKLGRRKLYLMSSAGESDPTAATTTDDTQQPTGHSHPARAAAAQAGLEKLDRLCREFDAKDSPGVSWLDKLAQRRIASMQRAAEPDLVSLAAGAGALSGQAAAIQLTIEFPNFKHPIVYHQKTYNPQLPPILSEQEHKERIFVLHDPEISKANPIEAAYHKMARSTKGLDRDLKPSKREREEIAAIISSPNKRLTADAKELLWKFRFSLTDDQRAVTKFLRAVTWSDVVESRSALELLSEWGPITLADALELLSASFPHEGVREYAVRQLQAADQEELGNYLLQLVQALRYEQQVPSVLSEFLITRACQSMSLANFFHWYVTVECHDARKGTMYTAVLGAFLSRLSQGGPVTSSWLDMLEQQGRLIQQLIALGDSAKANKGRVEKKVERMRALLQPDGDFKALRNFQQPIRVSVRPEVQVTGIVGEESTMFKSALAPLLVCFTTPPTMSTAAASLNSPTTSAGAKYKVIFKSGDDLRQDQLVIQLINLMDTLLKKVKLDLQLTPYRVLATGPQHGFVEFVPASHTLTSILDRFEKVSNPIGKFFEQHNTKPQTLAKVLETYVKSSAGYCVITYILGIGDRHLDNVMLTTAGHLFHIDFSFIFGRDPKPFPPPMKFSKEMVEAMGGADSGQYQDFRKYCCLSFNILRQHANLILNLLSLMGDANIPDLSADVEKNLLKVQEKFRLDLSDTEADGYILALIDQSVSALFPQIVEKIHKWALYWK